MSDNMPFSNIGYLTVSKKLDCQGDVDMNSNTIKNVANPSDPQDVATKDYVDENSGGSGGTNQNLTQVLAVGNDAGNQLISGVSNPTQPQDVATKDYVDSQGLSSGQNLAQVLQIGNDANVLNIVNLNTLDASNVQVRNQVALQFDNDVRCLMKCSSDNHLDITDKLGTLLFRLNLTNGNLYIMGTLTQA